MATRIKPTRKSLYQDDFYVWTRRQAECLRARRYDELDLENLIEEVAELGDAAKKSAREPGSHYHRASAQTPALTGSRSAGRVARYHSDAAGRPAG
jgi:hypothetical protein